MSWVMTSGPRGRLSRMALAAAAAGVALVGLAVPASAEPNDPGCDAFGWRHPMCAGGAWNDETASEEWGPAQTPGLNPFPGAGGQMVPNIDGSLSLPGTPGAI